MVAMTFAILNTWIALAGSIGLILPSGGSVAFLYGFIFCVLCNFALGASLGEMAAIWPTAGGQYHFVYAICSEKWRKSMVSFINAAWLYRGFLLTTIPGFRVFGLAGRTSLDGSLLSQQRDSLPRNLSLLLP